MLFQILTDEPSYVPPEVLSEHADHRRAIEERAYFLAQQRGFAPGHALEDWVAAQHQQELWERGCGRDPQWP